MADNCSGIGYIPIMKSTAVTVTPMFGLLAVTIAAIAEQPHTTAVGSGVESWE